MLPQRSPVSRVSTLRRSNSSSKLLSPRSNSRVVRALQRSQHSTPATVQRDGAPFGRQESEEVQETMMGAPSESNAGFGENDSPRLGMLHAWLCQRTIEQHVSMAAKWLPSLHAV